MSVIKKHRRNKSVTKWQANVKCFNNTPTINYIPCQYNWQYHFRPFLCQEIIIIQGKNKFCCLLCFQFDLDLTVPQFNIDLTVPYSQVTIWQNKDVFLCEEKEVKKKWFLTSDMANPCFKPECFSNMYKYKCFSMNNSITKKPPTK